MNSIFTDKLVARYRELGIDPTTKTIVFSNALDFGKALDIQEQLQGRKSAAPSASAPI